MIIQYASDFHLELSKLSFTQILKPTIVENNQNVILILAGDIGNPFTKNYFEFIKYT